MAGLHVLIVHNLTDGDEGTVLALERLVAGFDVQVEEERRRGYIVTLVAEHLLHLFLLALTMQFRLQFIIYGSKHE